MFYIGLYTLRKHEKYSFRKHHTTVSEYDQEIPQSHTADQPTAP